MRHQFNWIQLHMFAHTHLLLTSHLCSQAIASLGWLSRQMFTELNLHMYIHASCTMMDIIHLDICTHVAFDSMQHCAWKSIFHFKDPASLALHRHHRWLTIYHWSMGEAAHVSILMLTVKCATSCGASQDPIHELNIPWNRLHKHGHQVLYVSSSTGKPRSISKDTSAPDEMQHCTPNFCESDSAWYLMI